ncbi:hypothetical protein Clacol_010308 [Clathrus columnatus]|uniref:Uncharacterized protein n=1 Tax=Clathrus columnatus TaxID=1419009 RepID=A0AAV5ATE3_9AGAM|nr:hypothetical protein Clacol_010308 [Clathrus columnatus]
MSSGLYMNTNQSTVANAALDEPGYSETSNGVFIYHPPPNPFSWCSCLENKRVRRSRPYITQDDINPTHLHCGHLSKEKSPANPIQSGQNNEAKPRRKGEKRSSTSTRLEEGRQSRHEENSKLGTDEDTWKWLLKVEKDYVETIADATTELQNRIYTDGINEDDEDDEREYKYYHCRPRSEVSPLRIPPSEPWFAACYTDYRESYSSSESGNDEEEASELENDLELEAVDTKTMSSPDLPCTTCGKEACECTAALLLGMTILTQTANLWTSIALKLIDKSIDPFIHEILERSKSAKLQLNLFIKSTRFLSVLDDFLVKGDRIQTLKLREDPHDLEEDIDYVFKDKHFPSLQHADYNFSYYQKSASALLLATTTSDRLETLKCQLRLAFQWISLID